MSNLTLPFKKRAICCQTCTNVPAQRDGKKIFAWQTSKHAPKHRDVQASQGKRTRHGTALHCTARHGTARHFNPFQARLIARASGAAGRIFDVRTTPFFAVHATQRKDDMSTFLACRTSPSSQKHDIACLVQTHDRPARRMPDPIGTQHLGTKPLGPQHLRTNLRSAESKHVGSSRRNSTQVNSAQVNSTQHRCRQTPCLLGMLRSRVSPPSGLSWPPASTSSTPGQQPPTTRNTSQQRATTGTLIPAFPRSGQNSSDMLLGQDLEHVRQKYVLKGIFRPFWAENVLTGNKHCHKIRLSAYI